MKQLREIFGKGKLKDIYDAHQKASKKLSRRDPMQDYHGIQASRASRLNSIATGKILPAHKEINLKFDREDSKRAKAIKAKAEGKK